MNAIELAHAIAAHAGQFHCHGIHAEDRKKVVDFAHVLAPGIDASQLPSHGGLAGFYTAIGSVVFYRDARSDEAALHIAAPADWPRLRAELDGWFAHMEQDERDEYLPGWLATCLVIGEFPATGNYVLMVCEGGDAGRIVEFDHDGFEFVEQEDDLVAYAWKQLDPDATRLLQFASHLRFVDEGEDQQWWIEEMRDNRGNTVRTG